MLERESVKKEKDIPRWIQFITSFYAHHAFVLTSTAFCTELSRLKVDSLLCKRIEFCINIGTKNRANKFRVIDRVSA